MIAYIKGSLTQKSPTEVIVETGGLGYRVYITLNTYNSILNSKEVHLFTHHLVKEDAQALYGFSDPEELNVFEHLISVSGVGPNTARVLLSSMTPKDVKAAIIGENVAILKSAKGIGPKSAKRIILELKDKLLKDSGAVSASIAGSMLMSENPVREEALSALIALGFNKLKVQKTLNKLLKDNPSISDSGALIKLALGELS
jgi:Holliday junction DNA helicase RuvA